MSALADILATIPAEGLNADLVASGVARIDDGGGKVLLDYPYPAARQAARATEQISAQASQAGIGPVEVHSRFTIARRLCQGGAKPVPGVRNIIAVASAKGGVGKSVVAANLALALSSQGVATGLLDADIYGPSLPVMLGGGKPEIDDQERLVPLSLHGVHALSMGHLVEADQAVIWRGPMVIKALNQLLRGTAWPALDFLVVDMPPGTGDVQLSVAQTVPVTGAVIVTTPQQLAVADAVRGLKMFERVTIPVLGYVANMAYYSCPSCGQRHAPFGTGDDEVLAKRHGCARLAELPLDPAIGSATAATPLVAAQPDSEAAQVFYELAADIGIRLLDRPVDRGAAFPEVVAG